MATEHITPALSPFAVRFWAHVAGGNPDTCWPWTDRWTDKNGYGILTVAGAHQRAHRVAWTLTNGPVPPGLNVLHHCDHPPCCNPVHLYLGTQADNVSDMLTRRRRESLAVRRAVAAGQLVLVDVAPYS